MYFNVLTLFGIALKEEILAGQARNDLSGIDLSDEEFIGVDLSDKNLDEANLNGTLLIGANLAQARLNKANLIGADLMDADLKWTSLAGANLTGARLPGANLEGAILYNAILKDISYNDETLESLHSVDGLETAILDDELAAALGIDIEKRAKAKHWWQSWRWD
jgi:uncharacterized protein YjbI with pentapeptide repeats